MRKKDTPIIPWMVDNPLALQEIPIIPHDALVQGRLDQELERQRPSEAPKDDAALLKEAWYATVGEETARNARPLHFFRGILYVRVRNPIWLQELSLHKSRLLDDLNRFAMDHDVMRLRDLKLELGPLPPMPPAPEPEKPVWQKRELTPDLIDEIEERLAHLPENDLKASARRIMTQHFKRTRVED